MEFSCLVTAPGAIDHIQHKAPTDSTEDCWECFPLSHPTQNPKRRLGSKALPVETEGTLEKPPNHSCTRQKYPQPPFRSQCFHREWPGSWQGMEQPLEWDGRGVWVPARGKEGWDWGHQSRTCPEPPSGSPLPHPSGAAPSTGHEGTVPAQKSLQPLLPTGCSISLPVPGTASRGSAAG